LISVTINKIDKVS